MSWDCPHRDKEGRCALRKRPCEPLAKGCVLAGRYTFLEDRKDGKTPHGKSGEKT